ncbi:MAG: T9SS type A sorting domain-containing protein [Bacteroidota bacterium]
MRLVFLGLVLLPSLLFGQKHGHLWKLGYAYSQGGILEDSIGTSVLDFRNGDTLNLYPQYKTRLQFNYANTSICDTEGNYLFSSNGTWIYEPNDTVLMEGGEELNPYEYHGYLLPQGVLALPHPKDSDIYAFFYGTIGYIVWVTKTWYSEIDIRENNGLGKVILTEPLVNDTLSSGQFTAVKHGNGRDWWIFFQHYCLEREGCKSNFFYKNLLTPSGVEIFSQEITDSSITETGAGQAVFTPDGKKYIACQGDEFDEPSYIDVYDFDRCTGELGNRIQIETVVTDRGDGENGGTGGIAVSPNSRFLYFNTWKKIFQYDLWAEDIQASEILVAEYDGFVQLIENFPLATRFFKQQLAPDSKIYISTTNATQYLHVIHNPNEKGLACNVEQHGIYLPTINTFSIPNHPNYRLGAWEGSPCDTLSPISSTEQIVANEVKFFPNPSTGFLQLELDKDVPISQLEVRFYSLVGQQIAAFKGQREFDLSGLVNGVYVAEVRKKGRIVGREKIIIQR